MNQERVTRTTLPQVTVGIPLSLLKWVDEQAQREGMSRTAWIRTLIEAHRVGHEAGYVLADERTEVAS